MKWSKVLAFMSSSSFWISIWWSWIYLNCSSASWSALKLPLWCSQNCGELCSSGWGSLVFKSFRSYNDCFPNLGLLFYSTVWFVWLRMIGWNFLSFSSRSKLNTKVEPTRCYEQKSSYPPNFSIICFETYNPIPILVFSFIIILSFSLFERIDPKN